MIGGAPPEDPPFPCLTFPGWGSPLNKNVKLRRVLAVIRGKSTKARYYLMDMTTGYIFDVKNYDFFGQVEKNLKDGLFPMIDFQTYVITKRLDIPNLIRT